MPIAAASNYLDDEQPIVKEKTKTSSLNVDDAEAFPAQWGGGTSESAWSAPEGKSLADLASEVCPTQKGGLDLDQPIVIKMKRPERKPRIVKVRDTYKAEKKKLDSAGFVLYQDNGIPAGVPDKKAPCEMASVGEHINTLDDFRTCWRAAGKLTKEVGSNIRMFRGDFPEPSPDDEVLSKGGKYQVCVSKEIVQDTFEELCFYLMDKRLESAIVGVCWCVRQNFDLIQLWTKTASSTATQETFIPKLQLLLGFKDVNVEYVKLADAYPKKIRAHKYYLVESAMPSADDVVCSADHLLMSREIPNKREKKKGPDDFTEIHRHEGKKEGKPRAVDVSPTMAAAEPGGPATENIYGEAFDIDDDGDADTGGNIEIKEKKKPDKSSRKNSTKKGSRKEPKDVEFDSLPNVNKPLISQQVFVGAGLGGVLLVALLAMFMSGVLK